MQLHDSSSDPRSSLDQLKQKQQAHSEESWGPVETPKYEGGHYHDYFRAIPFERVAKLLKGLSRTLDDQSVLVASCGTGIDLFYLKKFFNPRFTVSDLSEQAVRMTQKAFPEVVGSVEDTENLSFKDEQFDYAFVAGALHHLPQPLKGLYELYRVSKKGVIAIEPNDSMLARVATRLGLATEVEPAGNYVYRVSEHDMQRVGRSLFKPVYVDRFFATHRVAKNSVEFEVLKAANRIANQVAPSQGNTLVLYLSK